MIDEATIARLVKRVESEHGVVCSEQARRADGWYVAMCRNGDASYACLDANGTEAEAMRTLRGAARLVAPPDRSTCRHPSINGTANDGATIFESADACDVCGETVAEMRARHPSASHSPSYAAMQSRGAPWAARGATLTCRGCGALTSAERGGYCVLCAAQGRKDLPIGTVLATHGPAPDGGTYATVAIGGGAYYATQEDFLAGKATPLGGFVTMPLARRSEGRDRPSPDPSAVAALTHVRVAPPRACDGCGNAMLRSERWRCGFCGHVHPTVRG